MTTKCWIVEKRKSIFENRGIRKFKTYYEAKKYYDSLMIPNKEKIYRIYEIDG